MTQLNEKAFSDRKGSDFESRSTSDVEKKKLGIGDDTDIVGNVKKIAAEIKEQSQSSDMSQEPADVPSAVDAEERTAEVVKKKKQKMNSRIVDKDDGEHHEYVKEQIFNRLHEIVNEKLEALKVAIALKEHISFSEEAKGTESYPLLKPGQKLKPMKLKEDDVEESGEQLEEAFDKSSPAHAKAQELVSNYGNRSAARAVYHGDGSATIHTTGDKKISSATRVDHIHSQADLGYNRPAEAYKNLSKSKGGLKFKTKETEGKSIYGSHEIHISHRGMKEEVEQIDEASNVIKAGRTKIVKVRVRKGKVQRRKKVSAVKGYTIRGGRLTRMKASERLKRKIGQRRGKMKRKAKMARALMRRKRSMRKRASLGLKE